MMTNSSQGPPMKEAGAIWGSRFKWKQLTLTGLLEICIPEGTRQTFAEVTLEIVLPTTPPTTFFVGVYDLPEGVKPGSGAFLLKQARCFVERCLPSTDFQRAYASGERWYDRDIRSRIFHVLAHDGPHKWWMIRLYSPKFRPTYYLLHWVGPTRYLRTLILPMMVSFEPLAEEGQ